MIPVHQTRFGAEGNCYAACIASIFEVPLADVPQCRSDELLSVEAWEDYHERLERDFFKPRGLYQTRGAAYTGDGVLYRPPGYSILCIETPGVVGAHAVVCLNAEIVFDPSPDSRPYEISTVQPSDWTTFGVLDPAQQKLP